MRLHLKELIPTFTCFRTMVRVNTSQSWFRKDGSKYKAKSKFTQAQYNARHALEWDIRIDVHDTFTSAELMTNISAHITHVTYCLISSVEGPDPRKDADPWNNEGTRSKHIHVHIALILNRNLSRADVVRMVTNMEPDDTPPGQVYCKPRPCTYGRCGWIAHHIKDFTKVQPTPSNCEWQYGTLPIEDLDNVSLDTLRKWNNVVSKYVIPHWEEELGVYGRKINTLLDESREGFIGPKLDQSVIKLRPAAHPDFNLPPHKVPPKLKEE